MDLTIVTFREIFQYEAQKDGRYADEYQKRSAVVVLDKGDMQSLGVAEGGRVLIENDVGRVVVVAKASEDEPNSGVAFMPNSPWSNQLVTDDICETSIPDFKRIKASARATDEKVTDISEILERMTA